MALKNVARINPPPWCNRVLSLLSLPQDCSPWGSINDTCLEHKSELLVHDAYTNFTQAGLTELLYVQKSLKEEMDATAPEFHYREGDRWWWVFFSLLSAKVSVMSWSSAEGGFDLNDLNSGFWEWLTSSRCGCDGAIWAATGIQQTL